MDANADLFTNSLMSIPDRGILFFLVYIVKLKLNCLNVSPETRVGSIFLATKLKHFGLLQFDVKTMQLLATSFNK